MMHTARRARALAVLSLRATACGAIDPFEHLPEESLPEAGAVVSQHPLATAVGLAILGDGGNAADAAVATALALAVVYPQAGNLGGGGFALWVPHAGEPASLDFREVAPAGYEARLETVLDVTLAFITAFARMRHLSSSVIIARIC